MNEDIVLNLPWPPTVNNYYKTARSGHRYIDKSVREYREKVEKAINMQVPGLTLTEGLFVEVYLYPPDARKRDLDNYMKGLLDALTIAKLWEDDSLIHQLHIYRGIKKPGGAVIIEISDAGPIMQH
ncbi:MAG: hypothetical protein DRI65_14205 [Chloroflexota bacterium]|nr:MAG: hypothetical protein DRI65_14205 [Chloroflexota bacterium]